MPQTRLLVPSTLSRCVFFFSNATATTEIYTLSLHDALPIYRLERFGRLQLQQVAAELGDRDGWVNLQRRLPVRHVQHVEPRSEEHTSELQSQSNLVCRLLLEKKK